MSPFYSLVKRLAALRLRLSQLQGKLKFAVRRSIRKLTLATVFAIDALEHRIRILTSEMQCFSSYRHELSTAAKNALYTQIDCVQSVNTPSVTSKQEFTVRCCEQATKNDNPSDEVIEWEKRADAYSKSLLLPDLEWGDKEYSWAEYYQAIDARYEFVINSLYSKVENDPTSPLLVFAPTILKNVHKYRQVWYWCDPDRKDYHIRASISREATTTYYDRPPSSCWSNNGSNLEFWNRRTRCFQGTPPSYERFFFCRNASTRQWEVWHYVNV